MNEEPQKSKCEERKQKFILVLAGNRKQFKEYVYQVSDYDDSRFIDGFRLEQIYGYRFDGIQIVGTFWDRNDAAEIYELAKSRIFPKKSL